MTLHILNKSATQQDIDEQLSACISDQDVIILIEDAVYHCLTTSERSIHWSCIAKHIYVLDEDATARGVIIPAHFHPAHYEDFVTLSTQSDKVLSWY